VLIDGQTHMHIHSGINIARLTCFLVRMRLVLLQNPLLVADPKPKAQSNTTNTIH